MRLLFLKNDNISILVIRLDHASNLRFVYLIWYVNWLLFELCISSGIQLHFISHEMLIIGLCMVDMCTLFGWDEMHTSNDIPIWDEMC